MGVSALNSAIRLLRSIFDTKSATEAVLAPFSKPEIKKSIIEQPFERCTPENAGISSRRVKEFLEKLNNDPSLNMHSVLILKDGKMIAEAAFGAQRTDIVKLTFSACKSIVSILLGILADEHKVYLDERLIDIFRDKVSALAKLQLRDLTVENLLCMKSGILFNEALSLVNEDWVHAYLSSAVYGKSGETFNYNSMNTFMLAAIIDKKSDVGFEKYLESRLFAPLGITGTYWEKSPTGLPKGGWGLYIKPEDFAKIGQMVLDGGTWKGKRIVSGEYLQLALRVHAETPAHYGDFNYGFQIWCGRKAKTFLFNGMLGQNVLAFCDNRIILVSNAGNDENFQQSNYFKYAADYFGGKLDDKFDSEIAEYRKLKKYISSLSAYKRFPNLKDLFIFYRNKRNLLECHLVPESDNAVSTGLLPIILQVSENTYTEGLKEIRFFQEENRFYMLYAEKSAVYKVELGIKAPVESELCIGNLSFHIAAKAVSSYDEDGNLVLKIQIDFMETPCTRIVKLRFGKPQITLEQSERPGKEYIIHSAAEFAKEAASGKLANMTANKIDKDYFKYKAEVKFEPRIEMREKSK